MQTYTAVVEHCLDTGLFVGYVPGFPGAHSQGQALDELNADKCSMPSSSAGS
jgi:predicted RNase H-like HicB family nuclease